MGSLLGGRPAAEFGRCLTPGLLRANRFRVEESLPLRQEGSALRQAEWRARRERMRQRPLGRTGFQVGEVGLGGNRIGNMEGVPDEHWLDLVRHARELGVTLFDSSPNYGRSEELLGRALAGSPDVLIATKCPP